MPEFLSDAELARIEEFATAAHGYGGDEQELGELALALVAEVRAARTREAASEWDDGNGRNAMRRLIGPWEPRPGICPECGYGIAGVNPIDHHRHLREEDND